MIYEEMNYSFFRTEYNIIYFLFDTFVYRIDFECYVDRFSRFIRPVDIAFNYILVSFSYHSINSTCDLNCQHMRHEVYQQKKGQSSINAVGPKNKNITLESIHV